MADQSVSDFPLPPKYAAHRVVTEDDLSVVLEASNRGTKRVVFLRHWKERGAADWSRHLARLVRAVVAAGSEHVLQVLDMEVTQGDDESPVLVLEAVKGRTLAEILENEGPLSVGRACRMAVGLAKAIGECHKWGIVPLEPTVDRVFLTQFAGQRDFVKVLAPNVIGVSDDEAKVRDSVGWVRVLWAALTGEQGPVPPDEEAATAKLKETTGAEDSDVEVLARLVVDGALGQEDFAELAGRLDAAGLADPSSVHPSVSFETRLPQVEPVAEEGGTLLDRMALAQPAQDAGGRIRSWHLLLAVLVGFVLGAASAGGVFWGVHRRSGRKRPQVASASYEAGLDAGAEQDARVFDKPGQDSGEPALKFAVAYYSPSALVTKEMGSLARYLTKALGRRVRLVDMPHGRAARMLEEGQIQIAVFSPYMYVLNRARYPHFKLLVSHLSDGNLTYQGFFVVRSESPITSLADTKGKRACFVSSKSTSGYLFPLALLKQKGIDPQRDFRLVRFSGTHEGVLADLRGGRCDFGAVSSPAYFNAVRSSALRIIAVTERIPGDAYCVTSHIPAKLVERIRMAFLAFNPRRFVHRPYMGKLHRITGFQEVDDSHYDPIRRVHKALFGRPITAKTLIRPLAPH